MKKEKKILIAFWLNLSFCIFEFIGGNFTGSIAIISDAIHDLGDAISIGISYLLERKSGRETDEKRKEHYSLLGGIITSVALIIGSVVAVIKAIIRLFNPVTLDYNGMFAFALMGVAVNSLAAVFTHGKENMNIRAVNLHMLEDVLGWVAVLIGAAVMKVTDFTCIDPIMSICVAVFILINAVKNLKGDGHSHCSHERHPH